MSYLHAGYPMAKNLRAKIPRADTLIICDVNKDVLHKFVEEVDTPKRELNVRIAADAREVAEKSVSGIISGLYVLSSSTSTRAEWIRPCFIYLGFVRTTVNAGSSGDLG
jgi:hypothetical protein